METFPSVKSSKGIGDGAGVNSGVRLDGGGVTTWEPVTGVSESAIVPNGAGVPEEPACGVVGEPQAVAISPIVATMAMTAISVLARIAVAEGVSMSSRNGTVRERS